MAGALALVLRRVTRPNRVYPPPPGSSGGGGGGKHRMVQPPPPRIVARLQHHAAMVALADRGTASQRAYWEGEGGRGSL